MKGAALSAILHLAAIAMVLAAGGTAQPEPSSSMVLEVVWQPPPPMAASASFQAPPPPPAPPRAPQPARTRSPAPPEATAAALPAPPAGDPAGEREQAAPPSAAPAFPGGQTRAAQYDLGATETPLPDYPWSARRRGREGRVVVRLSVDAGGRPRAAELAESSGDAALDHAALATLTTWRLRPALDNGTPIASAVLVPIRFELRRQAGL